MSYDVQNLPSTRFIGIERKAKENKLHMNAQGANYAKWH